MAFANNATLSGVLIQIHSAEELEKLVYSSRGWKDLTVTIIAATKGDMMDNVDEVKVRTYPKRF